ncbi:tachylectin-2-like [Hyperolius riggenbachi]|uniref:tachylectin-2-like n=1 Tax=Hyperolius riggenbachi TaxID=752182 RepID=UPI0035A32E9D
MSNFMLFALQTSNKFIVGLPPSNLYNFHGQAMELGKMKDARLVAYSPDDRLYVVRGRDLYRGPVRVSSEEKWFKEAEKVEKKSNWKQFKFIFFHPDGRLYAATFQGDLFEGPAPTNKNESWLSKQAQKIGAGKWNLFTALFFDGDGVLHGVTKSDFLKRTPPTKADEDWIGTSTTIGLGNVWSELSHFMAFDPSGNLWCVSKENGNIFMGPPPTHAQENWLGRAMNLGTGYHQYRILMLIPDHSIERITSLDFLVNEGRVISVGPELVTEQIYDNKLSSVSLQATFTVSKTYEASSSFSHDHGLSCNVKAKANIKAGIPTIISGSLEVGIDRSTEQNWNITKTNTNKVEFSNQFHFQVPPGKALKQMALVQKAMVEVPYRASVRTTFSNETTISGLWKGVCYFNLYVKQADI